MLTRGLDNLFDYDKLKSDMNNKKENKKNEKMIRVSEAKYHTFRRDQKAKKEIKALALMLYDKVKNWK